MKVLVALEVADWTKPGPPGVEQSRKTCVGNAIKAIGDRIMNCGSSEGDIHHDPVRGSFLISYRD